MDPGGIEQNATEEMEALHSETLPKPKTLWETYMPMIPICIVMALAVLFHMLFIGMHCVGMMSPRPLGDPVDKGVFFIGVTEACIYFYSQSLFLYCYFRCMFTLPGSIPDEVQWKWIPEPEDNSPESLVFLERKQGGERRYCRWCMRYKPDRTHHCRTCRACILKMDHHCPWINNCVGYRNHKFFLLCIFYALIGVDLAAVTHFLGGTEADFFDSQAWSLIANLFFGFFSSTFTLFCVFHTYLVLHGYTTLELRERVWKTKGGRSPYDRGMYDNICSVLGPNPLLWFIPVQNSPGDGIFWETYLETDALLDHRASGTNGEKLPLHSDVASRTA